jgi:hypothetical protein
MAHAPTPALTHPTPAGRIDAPARRHAHPDAASPGRRLPVDPASTIARSPNEPVLPTRSAAR